MNLKSAALLALIAMALLTVVLAVDFINTFLAVMRDLLPMLALLRTLIYVLASLSLLMFFYVFYKRQS